MSQNIIKQIGENLITPFNLLKSKKQQPSTQQVLDLLNRIAREQNGIMNSSDIAREIAKPLSTKDQAYLQNLLPVDGINHIAKLDSKFESLNSVKEYKKALNQLRFQLEAAENLYTHLIDGQTELTEAAFATLQAIGELKQQISKYEFDMQMMIIRLGVTANLNLANLYAENQAIALIPRNLADRPDRLLEDLTKAPFEIQAKPNFKLVSKDSIKTNLNSQESAESVSSEKLSLKDLIDLINNVLGVLDQSPTLRLLTLAFVIKLLFFVNFESHNYFEGADSPRIEDSVTPGTQIVGYPEQINENVNVYNFHVYLTQSQYDVLIKNNHDFEGSIPFVFDSEFSISYANHVKTQVSTCLDSALNLLPANAVPTYISVNNLALTKLHFSIEDGEGQFEDSVPLTGYQFECLNFEY